MKCPDCGRVLRLVITEMYLPGMMDHEERREWICIECDQKFMDSVLVDDEGRMVKKIEGLTRRRRNGD